MLNFTQPFELDTSIDWRKMMTGARRAAIFSLGVGVGYWGNAIANHTARIPALQQQAAKVPELRKDLAHCIKKAAKAEKALTDVLIAPVSVANASIIDEASAAPCPPESPGRTAPP